jgi:dynein heavy chain
VSFGKTAVKARNNVENWLTNVEDAMVSSLKRLAKAGMASYVEDPRSQWVLQQPAQLVIAVSQVFWCHAVEQQLQAEGPGEGLASFYQVGWARARNC